MLSAPPRLYSHAGWRRLDGEQDEVAASSAWQQAIEDRARWASHSPNGGLVCIHTFDGVVELWDVASDALLLREQVQGLEQVLALDDGYVARGEDGAWLYLRAADSKQRLLETKVSAMALDGHEIALATGNEVHRFDLTGKRLGRLTAAGGIAALVRAGDAIAVGYRDGSIDLLPLDAGTSAPHAAGPVEFQGVPSSAPRRMLAGPMDTLIAGYDSGFVGIWNRRDGTLLVGTRLHGQIAHLLLEGRHLYAATDLGRHIRWDLSAFHVDYCTLMRQVWDRVPVVWQAGRPTLREPPTEHGCR
jgi:hypothetical protein